MGRSTVDRLFIALEQGQYRDLLVSLAGNEPYATLLATHRMPDADGVEHPCESWETLAPRVLGLPLDRYDPDLAALAIVRVIAAHPNAPRDPQSRDLVLRLHNRLRQLEGSLRRPAARVLPLRAELVLATASRDEARIDSAFRELQDRLSAGSDSWTEHLLHRFSFLSLRGRGREIGDAAMSALLAQEEHWPGVRAHRYIDAVEGGRMGEAAALRPDPAALARRPELSLLGGLPRLVHWYIAYERVMAAVMDRCQPDSAALAGLISALGRGMADDLRRLDALLRRDETAIIATLPDTDAVRTASTVSAMAGIRAALVLRNAALARQLLEIRSAAHARHWLDLLFRARLLRLEGDTVGAAHTLGEALAEATALNAVGRFEFELRLAWEMGLTDLVRLHQPAEAVPRPSAPAGRLAALVGASGAMATVREQVARYAPHALPVLITGPTGSGKEVVARLLHRCSPRAERPFVTLNCSAVPDNLIESELFGHVRGAFSGAESGRGGLVAEAGDGTLLLDEIGDASPRFQAALLRLLESGEYRQVGGDRVQRAACRILAATNVDLGAAVAAGRFRADLYHRLRRLEVVLVPLAERPEDVVPLALHLLAGIADGRAPGLTAELADHLMRRSWPGNVRELRNALERLVVLDPHAAVYGLPAFLRAEVAPPPPPRAAASAVAPPAAVPVEVRLRGRDRRLDRLRELIAERRRLTRREVIRLLAVSPGTASTYLDRLVDEGVARRIEPTRAPGSHFWEAAT